jgi:hypothetical protein
MPRRLSANELIRRRIQKWQDEDPSSLVTKQIEKATTPLQWLVALLLPDTLVREVVDKTLWVAEALTDRDDVFKVLEVDSLDEVKHCKLEACEAAADQVHAWAIGAAAALGAWDLAGPLGLAPSLAAIFTLSFRTIKKTAVCYGFDPSSHVEELVAMQVFAAASSLYHRDKLAALKEIQRITETSLTPELAPSRETVMEAVLKLSQPIAAHLTRRRSFAAIPAMGALVGSSANAWLLKDVGWAARNIFAMRRLEEARAKKAPSKPVVTPPDLKAA